MTGVSFQKKNYAGNRVWESGILMIEISN